MLRRRRLLITAAVLVVVFAVLYGLFQVSKSRTFQFFGELIDRVDTTEKVVALTFDDAPSEFTPEVLDILRDKQVPGTFYLIGQQIAAHPELAAQIAADGHELGNHSYTHQRMVGTHEGPGFVRSEIERTDELIRATGYTGEITFRPPYAKKLFVLPWYLARHDRVSVTWDVEPDTEHAGDASGIEENVVANVRPGSIVLLHPFCAGGCAADRAALPRIIDRLRAEGYAFRTVAQLRAATRGTR